MPDACSCATSDELRAEISRLEEALEAERTRHITLSEYVRDVIFRMDLAGGVQAVEGNALGVLGVATSDASHRKPAFWLRLVHPKDRTQARALFRRVVDSGSSEQTTIRVSDVSGEYRWISVRLDPDTAESGAVIGYRGVAMDVTHTVRQAHLVASLNRAAETVQSVGLTRDQVLDAVTAQLAQFFTPCVLLLDPATDELVWDRATVNDPDLAAFGIMVADGALVGARIPRSELGTVDQCLTDRRARRATLRRDTVRRLLSSAQPGPSRRGAVLELSDRDVIVAPLVAESIALGILIVMGGPIVPESVAPVAAFANQAALALRTADLVQSLQESEERYRNVFESVAEGLTLFDSDGRILDVNPASCGMYGYDRDELIGMHLSQLVHPDHYHGLANFAPAVNRTGIFTAQTVNVRKDGTLIDVEIKGTALTHQGIPCFLSIDTDITERLRSQEMLVRSEKLRALGQMAGGVAHDFNNLLLAIRGFCSLALLEMEDAPQMARADLEKALASSADAAEAVRRLQALYRDSEDTSDFGLVTLEEVVREAIALTEPRWKDELERSGATIQVTTDLKDGLQVRGNGSELRRVVSNLILNAVDAMPEGGLLQLSTAVQDDMCCIVVQDTGTGMTPDVHSHLFEPLFTTKKGSGAGLGLAVSVSIIERHGGHMDVETERGVGSCFTVWLPRPDVTPMANLATNQPQTAMEDTTPLRVLVADDEASIVDVMRRYLERLGHKVTSAGSGDEAIARLGSGRYDLLITDLGMPEISGHQVVKAARESIPEMPIIVATGWGETITPEQMRDLGASTILSKPYTLSDLERALGTAMSHREATDTPSTQT